MSMVELASHDEFSKIESSLQASVEETLKVGLRLFVDMIWVGFHYLRMRLHSLSLFRC